MILVELLPFVLLMPLRTGSLNRHSEEAYYQVGFNLENRSEHF